MENKSPSTETTEVLWKSFHRELNSFIYSKVHDEAIAEDILQEVFIRIHEKIGSLKDKTRVKSWIYQIARNLIMDHFRKTKKLFGESEMIEEPPEILDRDFMTEAIGDMVKMMDDLPAGYCQALCLTEIQGISIKDYANQAGITYTAAKTRVHRARGVLRDMLMRCCHYQFDRYGTVFGIAPHCCCCPEEKHHN